MVTNLPPHLQEKIKEMAWNRAMDECHKRGISPSGDVYESVREQFILDAVKIHSILLQELRPVVEALRSYGYTFIHNPESDNKADQYWTDKGIYDHGHLARQTLKHLKERVLNGDNT